VVGTPKYMAPESILEPDTVDARTDIYALGAVAYYLVEACPVEPWDGARALAWWREYQRDLDGEAVPGTGEAMTIAVDGAYRSTAEPAGSVK
jgi:serine/threonine protein kinase